MASTLHIIGRQAAVLTRMAHALTTEPVLDTFLGQVLTAIAEQLHAERAALWFHDRTQDTLAIYMTTEQGHILVASQMGDATPQPRAASEMPLWQELRRARHPIFIANVAHDSRVLLRHTLAAQGVKTLLMVPLLCDDEVTGWMSIRGTTPRRYQPEEFALAQALSQHVTLAVQLSYVAEQRRQAAVLEERTRMAREIHDTLAQGLTGIVVQLEAAEDVLADAPAEARVIVLTTYDTDEDIYRALRAGAKAYLLKDTPREELLDTIRAVSAGRTRVPSDVAAKLAERVSSEALTAREGEVLRLIVAGNSNREIATLLYISEGTVKTHVNHILMKLGVSDRTQAVTTALKRGLVSLD